MKPLLLLSALLLTAPAGAIAVAPAQERSPRAEAKGFADLVVRNVTVIDPERSSRTAGRDVVIRDGRIVAVVATGSRRFKSLRTIEGAGKFVMPGLFDMHTHASFRPVHIASLKLMTAYGVTAIREMGSDCVEPGGVAMCLDEMKAAQAKLEAGELVGPRIVELATAKVSSNRKQDASPAQIIYTPVTADEARATATALAARGPDIVKTSEDLRPDAFAALLSEAKARRLKVGGHIPTTLSIAEVSAMGIDTIEHARDLPLDCSRYGAEYRAQVRVKLAGGDGPAPDRRSIPAKARDQFDPALCKAQIAAMVAHGTYYVPTHVTREMDYRASEAAYRNDPRMQYVSAGQRRQWNRDLDRTAALPPEMVKDLTDFFAVGLRTTKLASDAGVKIMVGTDANDTMIFPGLSLHDELVHLVKAGLTPMQVLRAATTVPAEYLGRKADFGGVSPGKLADLLILNADPSVDIANSRSIDSVVQGGRVHDRLALDQLLSDVREWVRAADAKAADRR